ncbi:MAG: cofactor-independent phosphoglycerate mutase [bacterium]
MKYVILVGDGMADYKIKELGNKTPLQAAITPNMDYIAKNGVIGMVNNTPKGMPVGSDVANLSVLGYEPEKYYTGRAPLEAVNIGVKLDKNDVAYRCNFVFIEDNIMKDFSAGHISTEEALLLIEDLNSLLSNEDIYFYTGKSYRNLMVHKNGSSNTDCTPPHDIVDRSVEPYLPKGEEADLLIKLIDNSQKFLITHEVNLKRLEDGLNPANSIWLWGQGNTPSLPLFKDLFGLSGSIISAVDLLKGIGKCIGFNVVDVPGATGYLDTNYQGKAEYALKELSEKDLVLIHVEAPDEASHNGDLKAKMKAIEDFDEKVVGYVLKEIKDFGQYKIMVLPDHPTPLSLRTHVAEAVPFAILDSGDLRENLGTTYDEEAAGSTGIYFENGNKLMRYFLG